MTEIESGVQWDAKNIMNDYTNGTYDQNEDDLDMAANNSAKLFERSRIKALAGKTKNVYLVIVNIWLKSYIRI